MTMKFYVIAGKVYGRCAACGRLVRVNKPLIGSLHFCTEEDDPT